MKITFATKRDQLKFLKILMQTPARKGGYFIVDANFYDLFPFSADRINQILSALDEQEIIRLTNSPNSGELYLQVLQKAYSFIPEQQELNRRFRIPVIISIVALVISIASIICSIALRLWI